MAEPNPQRSRSEAIPPKPTDAFGSWEPFAHEPIPGEYERPIREEEMPERDGADRIKKPL